MTADAGSNGNGVWHAIRPWTPPLSLNTREITSVSVTFILSSHLADLNDDALGLIMAEEANDDNNPAAEGSLDSEALEPKKKSVISDALAKGLSVNVNGSPWQRVFIRVDDAADEAVIIIYGLMPGRQYDIDLGLVQGDSNNKIRRQVVTEDADLELEPPEEPTDPESPSFSHSTSSDPAPSTPSTSPSRTLPNTPPSSDAPITADEHVSQLERTLSVLNAERETLTSSLKSSRRDSQKADASLRSEIDILKRASEKHVAAEQRAKQKILSLQEALKRAQTATRETEELVKQAEQVVPELKKQREEKEKEYVKVKEEADRVRKEKDRLLEKEKKKIETMKTELAGLTNKAEKLNAKKEKLETSTISELEEQLKEVEREIEKVEKESTYASVFPDPQEFLMDDFMLDEPDPRSPAYPYLPLQRMRQPVSPGTIGRPGPIQRPQPSEQQLSFLHQPSWSLSAPPRQQPQQTQHAPSQSHSQSQPQPSRSHNPRSSSLQYQHTPNSSIPLTNSHRHLSLKSTGSTHSPTTSAASSTSAISMTTSTSPTTPTSISTLSSRAPAFEPGRPLKNSTSSHSSHSSTSSNQRSTPGPGLLGPGFSRATGGKSINTTASNGSINTNANTIKTKVRSHSVVSRTVGQHKSEPVR